MPQISIIIPAYNAEATIRETLQSVQNQTLNDFEIIVINDGSTDNTLSVLEHFQDSRLKTCTYENAGLSIARNRGMSHASGKYFAFLDADDLWTPDKLELQLLALEKSPDVGLAYSWTGYMSEDGQSFHNNYKCASFEGNVLKDLLIWNFIESGSNPLLRREVIDTVGGFDPSVAGAADWDYWLRVAMKWHYTVVPKPQILYRQSASSMSSKVEFMEKCQLDVLNRAYEHVPPELQQLKQKSYAYVYQYSAQLYLARGSSSSSIEKALEKLIGAIQTSPNIVLQRKTITLILKIVVKKLLPSKIANSLLKKISSFRAKVSP